MPEQTSERDLPPALDPELEEAINKCRRCKNWEIVSDYIRVKELIENAVAKMKEALQEQKFKPTVADFLRLLEAEKELETAAVKEIKVTWVEDPVKSKS
jgi:hypothetical protein